MNCLYFLNKIADVLVRKDSGGSVKIVVVQINSSTEYRVSTITQTQHDQTGHMSHQTAQNFVIYSRTRD